MSAWDHPIAGDSTRRPAWVKADSILSRGAVQRGPEARTGFAFCCCSVCSWDGLASAVGIAAPLGEISRQPAVLAQHRRAHLENRLRSFADRFQYLSRPFTRPLNSPTSDSTQLLVTGKPNRRYRG